MQDMKILVANGNRANRDFFEKTLTAEGYRVISANDGREAVERFRQEGPDLVIMDVHMPELDGFDATKQIRLIENSLHIPIMLTSAVYRDLSDRIKGIEMGCNDYILQPIDAEELIFRVKCMLKTKSFFDKTFEVKKRLRSERDFAESIIETAHAIILILDADGRIVRFNPYMEEISGYRLEEVKGMDWFSTFLPNGDHSRIKTLFTQAVSGVQTRGNINPIVCKNGDTRLIEWYDTTIRDQSGHITGVLAIGQDITKQKKAEEEAEEAKRQTDFILGATGTYLNILDKDYNIRYIDNACRKRYGDPAGKKCYEYTKGFKRPCNGCKIREALEKKCRVVYEQTLPAEGNRPVYSTSIPFQTDQGEWLLAQIKVDITERKLAEEALYKYSERLKTLYRISQSIPLERSARDIACAALEGISELIPCMWCGVMILQNDPNASLLLAYRGIELNLEGEKGEMMTGITSTDTMLQKAGGCLEVDIKAMPEQTMFEKCLLKNKVRFYINAPFMAKGEQIGSLVLGAKDPGLFSDEHREIALEVSNCLGIAIQQARLREEVSLRSDQLERSLHEKEILLKELHHRVKNNLQIISSLIHMQFDYIKDNADLEIFRQTRNRVQSMSMIHEMLYRSNDLARVEFSEYIKDLTRFLSPLFRIKENRINISVDTENIPLGIDSAIPCGLIITELLSNALKHAFPNEMKGEVHICAKPDDGNIVMIVSDNGIGLPKDMDFRNTETLGLQIVITLVDQIKGSIELDKSNGTTFSIKFKDTYSGKKGEI